MINENSQVIQCFELQKGQINLTSGTVERGTHIIHCVEDAQITLTWAGSDTDDVTMKSGEDYAVRGCSVTISSGTVHIDTL
jgi:hypothetical protein